jgi:Ca-activated chloride channel family protein
MPSPQESHAEFGLRTNNKNDRIALRGVRLRCRAAGMSARTTLEQTFVNLEPKDIEAVYTFPLPEAAAVCGFEVVFFDKIFTGVVEESDQAIEQYDEAIAQGHGAYLLEQNRPDVFTVRVGNLKPRQAVTIRLTCVQDLEIVDRAIRLAFPTTIAPRYVSGAGTDPLDTMIDGHALNPPHVLSVPYGLTMDVEIDLGKSLTGIKSPSHEIAVKRLSCHPERSEEPALSLPKGSGRERRSHSPTPDMASNFDGRCFAGAQHDNGGVWKVSLAGATTEMDRDVVLELELAKEQEPFAISTPGPNGERFLAVTFVPQFEDEDFDGDDAAPQETVFVLDCSGSMMGESIEQARAALECCLRAMSAGDTFNACRFGSTYEMLAPEPLAYSQETLNRALAFVRQTADLGGTELYAPLEEILSARPARGSRNLVLLTDGQVSNEPAVIELARRHRARNRIFTFGIGPACSAFLVKGLARVTGGAAEFITPGERIEDKVLRTFGQIASPPVTDVELELANADAEIAPKEIPAVFESDAVRLYARLPGRTPETITLRCKTPAGPRSWTVPVRESTEARDTLPTFWARAMIRSIEDNSGLAASAAGKLPEPDRARLLDLSRRYNLLCSLTSFIAVEHRSLEDRAQGKPAVRRVPVMLAQDWGGVEEKLLGGALPAMASLCMAPAPAPAAPSAKYRSIARRMATPPAGGGIAKAAGFVGGLFKKLADSAPRQKLEQEEIAATDAAPPGDDLIDLLSHQLADGAFAIPAGLSAVNPDEVALLLDPQLHNLPAGARSSVVQTFAALLLLRARFADRQPTWKRAARKAVKWLTKALGVNADRVEELLVDLEARAPSGRGRTTT